MSRHYIPIARILGIPIGLDYSWFLIFVLLTWSLAAGYYPAEFPAWRPALYWTLGAATALVFFVSVLLHELGHAVVARWHRIPVRSITLFVFGGIAQIAGEPVSARADFWIAIAGPTVSFALAAAFGLLRGLASPGSPFEALVEYLAYINLVLGLFNLVPGFPLDGGRILRAIIWSVTQDFRRATLTAATVGRGIAFLFIVWGVWQLFTGRLGNGLWIAFIGWFLESAASAQIQQLVVEGLLAGRTVAEVMTPHYVSVDASTPLQDLVERHILPSGRRCFVVERVGEVVGLVTVHQVKDVPRERWPVVIVAEAMTPINRVKRVAPETGVWAAIKEMDRDGVNQLPVMTDGRVVGMLSREDVITVLRAAQEVGA